MPTQTNSSPEISLTHHMTRANGVLLHYLHVLGDSHFVIAAATATAFALMLVTHTLHSPAGSDPLIVISAKASWGIFAVPRTRRPVPLSRSLRLQQLLAQDETG